MAQSRLKTKGEWPLRSGPPSFGKVCPRSSRSVFFFRLLHHILLYRFITVPLFHPPCFFIRDDTAAARGGSRDDQEAESEADSSPESPRSTSDMTFGINIYSDKTRERPRDQNKQTFSHAMQNWSYVSSLRETVASFTSIQDTFLASTWRFAGTSEQLTHPVERQRLLCSLLSAFTVWNHPLPGETAGKRTVRAQISRWT